MLYFELLGQRVGLSRKDLITKEFKYVSECSPQSADPVYEMLKRIQLDLFDGNVEEKTHEFYHVTHIRFYTVAVNYRYFRQRGWVNKSAQL